MAMATESTGHDLEKQQVSRSCQGQVIMTGKNWSCYFSVTVISRV